MPLFPELELPVLSTNKPLTPKAPAFDVISNNAPLLVAVLKPVITDTRPPVVDDEAPADK